MDIEDILRAQRSFFQSGSTREVAFRKMQLKRLLSVLKQYESRIYEALWIDLHKSEEEAFLTELSIVYGEIKYALGHIGKWTRRRCVSPELKVVPSRSYIHYEPLGTALIIAPWNYPVNLLFCPLVGAIAAGCTAVLKSSPYAPHVDFVMREIVESVFKPEYISYVQGGRDVNTKLLAERWDMIFYTGSPRVGHVVMQAAAQNLTPCVLELGGKSPCIVDRTADIDAAARRIVWGKFINAGQTCIAPDYLMVHKEVKNQLFAAMSRYISQFFGADPKTSDFLCRIVSDKAVSRLLALLDGVRDKVVFGGRYDVEERYIEPTIIDGVSDEDAIMQEEIFGPLLPAFEFGQIDEVISYVNSHEKPLAMYYFGKEKEGWSVINQTSSGGACINDTLMHISNSNLPFGGVGNSGMGKYHRRETFLAFSNPRAVLVTPNWFDLSVKFAPFKGLRKIKRFLS